MASVLGLEDLFRGRHFDREIMCVRWYLRFKLSFLDLVKMSEERGLSTAHTTIIRWEQHYALEFERRWNHFAQPAGTSWGVDETYLLGLAKGRPPVWLFTATPDAASFQSVDLSTTMIKQP